MTSYAQAFRNSLLSVLFVLLLSVAALAGDAPKAQLKVNGKVDVAAQQKARAQFAKLPLSFEANQGQSAPEVKFLSRGAGYALFLTKDESALMLGAGKDPALLRMKYLGANKNVDVLGLDRLRATSSYFLGNDRSKWHTGIANFARTEYKGLYSGVDLVYYGNNQKIEHDFVVAPNADPSQIKFALDGAKKIALDAKTGDLVVTLASGEMRMQKPNVYQTIDGQKKAVEGSYRVHGKEIAFNLGAYDKSKELTIDPVLILSTYLSDTNGITATAVTLDGSGDIYVTGSTQATGTNFLSTGTAGTPRQTTGVAANLATYVAEINPSGSQLIATAIVGGTTGDDFAKGIAFAGSNITVVGQTQSTDFPTTTGAFQTTAGSTQPDGFIYTLSTSFAALDYSTYFGGDGADSLNGVAVTGGLIYVAGQTASTNITATTGAFQTANAGGSDGIVAVINPAGGGAADGTYITYLGGTGADALNALAAGGSNAVFVAGSTQSSGIATVGTLGGTQDALAARFDTTTVAVGTGSAQCNQQGTNGSTANGTVTVTASNNFTVGELVNAVFTGGTNSADFNGTHVAITAASGTSFSYINGTGGCVIVDGETNDGTGTVYGGPVYITDITGAATSTSSANGVATNGASAFLVGTTNSAGQQTTNQPAFAGTTDAFVATIGAAGTKDYFTYLGGTTGATQTTTGNAIAFTGSRILVTGQTDVVDFLSNAIYGTISGANDSFIAKINPAGTATDVIYATVFGGTGTESGNGIASTSGGAAVVVGNTSSADSPVTGSAFQPTATGSNNGFVVSLDANSPTASLLYGTNSVTPINFRADTNTTDTLHYTYVVSDNDPANDATTVVFNAPQPSGATFNNATAQFQIAATAQSCPVPTPSPCEQGTAGITCRLGTLTANNAMIATVCVDATPATAAPGSTVTLSNVTTGGDNAPIATAGMLTATVVNSTQANLSIATTTPTGGVTIADGGTFTDRLTFANAGPNAIAAGQAKVTIDFTNTNASLSNVSLAPSAGLDCGSGDGVTVTGATLPHDCSVSGAGIANGASSTVDITPTISLTGGNHTGLASVTFSAVTNDSTVFQFDGGSTTTGNQATNVATLADLSSTASGTSPVTGGATATFNITTVAASTFSSGGATMNANTAPSADLAVTITLQTGAAYSSVNITPADGDDCGAGANAAQSVSVTTTATVHCTITNQAAGSTHHFTLAGTASISGTNTTGSIKVDTDVEPLSSTYTDVDPTNNTATTTTTITPVTDLRSTTSAAASVVSGNTVTLNAAVDKVSGNSLPAGASQYAITITPTNSDYGTATVTVPTGQACTGTGVANVDATHYTLTVGTAAATITCTQDAFTNNGDTQSYSVAGTASITGANTGGSVAISATVSPVSSAYSDPTAANDTSSASTTLIPLTDLKSTVTGTSPVIGGQTASYTATAAYNAGNALAAGAAQYAIVITPTNSSYTTVSVTPPATDDCGSGAGTVVNFASITSQTTVNCTLGAVGQSGGTASHAFSVSGTVAISGTNTSGSVDVAATVSPVSSAYSDPTAANDTSNFTTNITPLTDLRSQVSGTANVNAASSVNFNLSVDKISGNAIAAGAAQYAITITPTNASYTTAVLTVPSGMACTGTGVSNSSATTYTVAVNTSTVTATCTLNAFTNNGDTQSFSLSSLATITGSNSSGTIQVTGVVSPVASAYSDPTAANNTASFTTTLIPTADLRATVTGAASVNGGGTASFNVNVLHISGNALGAGTAQTAITVTPTTANYTTVTVTPPAGDDCGAGAGAPQTFTVGTTTGNVTCTLGAVAQGSTHTFVVSGTAAITGTNTAGSINVAQAISSTGTGYNDTTPGNNTANATTNITPAADLSSSVSGTASVNSTATANFTVTVAQNSGNALAAGAAQVAVTITPTSASYSTVTITPQNGDDCGAGANAAQTVTVGTGVGNVTCTLAAVAQGSTHAFAITGTGAITGTNTTGTIKVDSLVSPVASAYFDTNAANDAGTFTTTLVPTADLTAQVTGSANSNSGSAASFTVNVVHSGGNALPAGAATISVTPTFANLTYGATITPTSGDDCGAGANAAVAISTSGTPVTCTLGAVAQGSTHSFTVTGTATITGTATSSSLSIAETVNAAAYNESNAADNSANATTNIVPTADLAAAATGPAFAADGATGVNYVVNINSSASSTNSIAAGAATLTGTFSGANASFTITAVPAGCSGVGTSTFVCTNQGQIDAGGTEGFTITGTTALTGGATSPQTVTLTESVAPTSATTYNESNNADNTVMASTMVIPSTDLAPSVTAPASVRDGQTASITITVNNNGAAAANDLSANLAQVSGTLVGANAGTTIALTTVPANCSISTTTTTNDTYTCTIDTALAHGANVSYTLMGTASVTRGIADAVTTSATVAPVVTAGVPGYADSNTGNDTATPGVTLVQPNADLAVTITPPTATFDGATNVNFLVTVNNNSATAAGDLAAGAAFVSGTFSGTNAAFNITAVPAGCTGTGTATFSCNIAALAHGGNTSFTITGTPSLTNSANTPQTLGVMATLAATQNTGIDNYFETNAADNTFATSTEVQPATDLQPSINAPAATVNDGATGTFTINVTNNGAAASNDLGANMAHVSGTFTGAHAGTALNITSAPGCTISTTTTTNDTYDCTIASTLAHGATTSFTIMGTASVTQGIQDTLTVAATVAPTVTGGVNNYFDSNTGNDGPTTATTQVVPVTDLQPSFTTVPATVQNNTTGSFTVTVTNNGTTTANDLAANAAKVTGTFSGPNSSFNISTVPAGCSISTTTSTNDTFTCVLGAIAHSGTQAFTIQGTATETSGKQDTLSVSATVSPNTANDYFDSVTGNDSTNASTQVTPHAILATSINTASTIVHNNTAVSYTVTISNTGDSISTSTVTGSLGDANANLHSVTATPSSGSCVTDDTAHTYTCTGASVPNGGSYTLTLSGTATETTGTKTTLTVDTAINPTTAGDFTFSGSNTASNTNVQVQPHPNFTTSVSTASTLVANNAAVSYLVTIANSGDTITGNGHVTGSLGNANVNLHNVTATPSSGSCSTNDTTHTYDCTGVSAPNGGSFTLTLTGTATETTGVKTTLTVDTAIAPVNAGDFDSTGSTSITASNSAVMVQPHPNFTTTVSTTSGIVANNAAVSYTVTIANAGDTITTGHVTGSLGNANANLNTVTATPSSGACTTNDTTHTYDCTGVTVTGGSSFTLTLAGTATETTGVKTTLTVDTAINPTTAGDYDATGSTSTTASNTAVMVTPHPNFTTTVATASTTVANNSAVTYTVTIANAGDTITTGHVTGSLGNASSNLHNVTATPSSGACTTDDTAHTYDCTAATATGGGSYTLTLAGTATETTGVITGLTVDTAINPTTAGDYDATGSTSTTANNTAVQVQPHADMALGTITASASVTGAGSTAANNGSSAANNATVDYAIPVTNNGPDAVSTSRVTGSFSGTNVTFSSTASTAGCSFVGQSFTCTLGTNFTGTTTIHLIGTVNETNGLQSLLSLGSAAPGPAQVFVSPAAVGDYIDGTGANDAAVGQPFTTNVVPQVDLALSAITSNAIAPSAGQPNFTINHQGTLTFDVNVTSNVAALTGGLSPDAVSTAQVVGNILTSTAATTSATYSGAAVSMTTGATTTPCVLGAFAGGTASFTCSLPANYTPGTSTTIHFTGTAQVNSGSTSGTITVSGVHTQPATAGDYNDQVPANDTTAPFSVEVIGTSNLAISISATNAAAAVFGGGANSTSNPALVGNGLIYTVNVSNDNTVGGANVSDASGVVVSVPILAGQTINAAGITTGQGSCSVSGQTVTCNLGTVAAGTQTASPIVISIPVTETNAFAGVGTTPAGCTATTTGTSLGTGVNPRIQSCTQPASYSVDQTMTFNPTTGANATTQTTPFTVGAASHLSITGTTRTPSPVLINSAGTAFQNWTITTTIANAGGASDATSAQFTDTIGGGNLATVPSVPISATGTYTVNGGTGAGTASCGTSLAGATISGTTITPGTITCTLPRLDNGNTATITYTVVTQVIATGTTASLNDTTNYTSSDVYDPSTVHTDQTTTGSTQVFNTIGSGTLPRTANASGKKVVLTFPATVTPGNTTFDTTVLGSGVFTSGSATYTVAKQQSPVVQYNFTTTAVISGNTTVCIEPIATFVKPERVRMFQLGSNTDVTISQGFPAFGTPSFESGFTAGQMVCGSIALSNGTTSVIVIEPDNHNPVVPAGVATDPTARGGAGLLVTNITSASGKGLTGSGTQLDFTVITDPDNADKCNGSTTTCTDVPQLRYYVFGKFQNPTTGVVLLSGPPANANTLVTLAGGNTFVRMIAVDQTYVVNSLADLVAVDGAGNPIFDVNGHVTLSSKLSTVNANNPTGAGASTQEYSVTSSNVTSVGGGTSSTGTLKAGQAANFSFSPTITGSPAAGSTVTLACSQNVTVQGGAATTLAALNIICSVSPNTFVVGSGTQPVVLISTSGVSVGSLQPMTKPGDNPAAPVYAVWLAFLGMPLTGMVFMSNKRSKRTKVLVVLGFLVLLIATQVACGGGGIGSAAPKLQSQATPAGTYIITVNGTQGSTVVTTNTFQITVQ